MGWGWLAERTTPRSQRALAALQTAGGPRTSCFALLSSL